MEKEFVPYEQALALKELGFDEPCIAYYLAGGIRFKEYKDSQNKNSSFFNNTVCSIPLYQQAFRWFREKYNLYPSINIYHDLWMCLIKSTVRSETEVSGYIVDTMNKGYPTFKTYEEAQFECLKKLIELVEQNQDSYGSR
jgi:hypothetical protein